MHGDRLLGVQHPGQVKVAKLGSTALAAADDDDERREDPLRHPVGVLCRELQFTGRVAGPCPDAEGVEDGVGRCPGSLS